MRRWSIRSGNDGDRVMVYEHGLVNSTLQRLESTVDFVDGVLLRHALCGSGLPEFAWKIPVGRPKRDEEGFLENSVGSLLYGGYTDFVNWVYNRCDQDLVATIPLDRETLAVLEPEWADLLEEIDN